jgi:hypothetical protein
MAFLTADMSMIKAITTIAQIPPTSKSKILDPAMVT